MLIPLTRTTFETLIPAVGTGAQYTHCAGKIPDFLKRLLISVVGIVILLLIGSLLGLEDVGPVRLLLGITAGLYWLWGPVFWASVQNFKYRRFKYAGFWRGEVLDVYITEELVSQQETVNPRGELVITDNRERRLNLEVGDETGFTTRLQVPLKKDHQAIARGDAAEMVVLSSRSDLSRIDATTDIYIPDCNVWVSDYPYLQREAFIEASRRLDAAPLSGQDDRGYASDADDFGREPSRRRRSRYADDRDQRTDSRSGRTRDPQRYRNDYRTRNDRRSNDRNDNDQGNNYRDDNDRGDNYGDDGYRDNGYREDGYRDDRPRVDDYFPRKRRTPRTPGNGPR
jgi:hypothetical protein